MSTFAFLPDLICSLLVKYCISQSHPCQSSFFVVVFFLFFLSFLFPSRMLESCLTILLTYIAVYSAEKYSTFLSAVSDSVSAFRNLCALNMIS